MIHANIRRTPIIFAALAALVLAVAALALYVHPTQAQDGSSQTSVSEGDTDLPNDNSTPGRVAVGSSATGAIGTPGDQDRFAVDLAADHAYQFDLTGSPGGGGTLPDTYFRAIYNSAGRYQSDSYNDDFGGSRDSRVTFTPTESGTYYARVSGDRDETGTYTLSVTDVTPEQAIPSKPTGLAGAATHDAITLTWDDPDNDSITGYVILRRIPGVDPKGHFNELVANTGTAATTYTDNEVAAETRYTYRIKAINETGTSERSRWLHIDTPAAPAAEEAEPANEESADSANRHGTLRTATSRPAPRPPHRWRWASPSWDASAPPATWTGSSSRPTPASGSPSPSPDTARAITPPWKRPTSRPTTNRTDR